MKKYLILLLLLLSIPSVYSITATGGTITYVQDSGLNYTVHTFLSNGSFNVTGAGTVQVLVVAGGGPGGSGIGGGGGGGGLIYNNSYSVDTGSYTVVIGQGGTSNTSEGNAGVNGQNSSFGIHNALGGGQGGTFGSNAGNGGSGGGAGRNNNPGTGLAGQGYNGGSETGANNVGAGGGGANQTGFNASTNGGNGGAGNLFNLTGNATNYSCGGGGAAYTGPSSGNGGCGSAGNGASAGGVGGGNASNNTGSGGGGGSGAGGLGGRGGSGIVIVRYITDSGNIAYIQVIKNIVGNGTMVINNVSLYINTTSVSNGSNTTLSNGTYIVSENISSEFINNYTSTFSGDCDSDGIVTLNSGDAKVCTITNTYVTPVPEIPTLFTYDFTTIINIQFFIALLLFFTLVYVGGRYYGMLGVAYLAVTAILFLGFIMLFNDVNMLVSLMVIVVAVVLAFETEHEGG